VLKDIVLDKDVSPFIIEISFSKFQSIYINAKKTHDSKKIWFIWEQLEKTFQKWADSFLQRDYYTNITVYTCLKLLQADSKTPGDIFNKINLLEKYMDFFTIKYIDIIQEAFLLHMNKECYIPMYRYSKPKDLFYYIAKEIKMFIFSIFRKYINYQRKQNNLNQQFMPQINFYHDCYFDKQSLRKIPLEQYKHLLFRLITKRRPQNTNLNFIHTIDKYQESELCQLIKTLQSNN
jgi:hypothetical protein